MMPSAFDQGESSVYDNNKPPKTVMVGSIMYELIFSQEALDEEMRHLQQSHMHSNHSGDHHIPKAGF
jgi:hypothetical protein